MMVRTISHTEVSTALDCFAKHAFAYTGALTDGTALRAKRTAALLRDGRAWGAAAAQWHAGATGRPALLSSLDSDAEEQRREGVYDEAEYAKALAHLTRVFDHYTATVPRLALLDIEREIVVPIPSRRSNRASTRYRFQCFLDGVHVDEEGRQWIVEYKLRTRLSSDAQIVLSRQARWYAWAWWRCTGSPPAGVIMDERLNASPAEVKLNMDGRPSKLQSCTAEMYEWACRRASAEPDDAVLASLRAREWHKRTAILLRPDELEEAGWQLISSARLVQQLDSGVMYPTRNPSPARCPRCAFRDICATPDDGVLVDALYHRVTPKRERLQEAA